MLPTANVPLVVLVWNDVPLTVPVNGTLIVEWPVTVGVPFEHCTTGTSVSVAVPEIWFPDCEIVTTAAPAPVAELPPLHCFW